VTFAACRVDCRNTLGESCIWDPRDDSLYWTDIEEKQMFRLGATGEVTSFALPERAGFLLPRQGEGFIVGFADGIARADQRLTTFERLVQIEPNLPQTRVNDAAADPFGGVVFGTFDERDRQPVASVYRLGPDGSLRRLLTGVTISNGLAFSPDGGTMYFADTPLGLVRRFAIGADFLSFEEISPLAGPEIAPGSPDGATVDIEGSYWSARVWGGCVVRIAPDGRLMETIDLPVKGPTCVALGGDDLRRLFATTLRLRHSEEELMSAPKAGGLFEADVRTAGTVQRLCQI
jgi:L-arabinonolactonase